MKRSWIKRRRQRRLERETDAERIYKTLVMSMGRCLAGDEYGPHTGPLQGAHLAPCRGVGLPHGRANDIGPLCMGHHDQYDGRARGPLRDVPHAERMELGAGWIREARAFVAHVLAADEAPF